MSDIHLLPFPHVENPKLLYETAAILVGASADCHHGVMLGVGRPPQPQRLATKLYDTDTLKN